MTNKLHEGLELAEKRARVKDLDNNVDLDEVVRQSVKAEEQGYGLYKIQQKNKALFVQVITENIDVLVRSKYLTTGELSFLFSLTGTIELGTNAIIDMKTNQFLTVSDIANYLGKDKSGISRVLNGLIEKGIIFELVNSMELKIHKRNVSQRPLFMNPELVYAGDRNKIDATLARLILEFDSLERSKVLLEWKVWMNPNDGFGRLVQRKTYLKKKKEAKRK